MVEEIEFIDIAGSCLTDESDVLMLNINPYLTLRV